MTTMTVHTMGVHYKWQIPEVLRQQLWLAHNLREDLVSLQLAYDDDLKAIWSSYPDVAQAEDTMAAAEADAAALSERVKQARVEARSKKISTELTQQLRDAKKRLKDARQARRDAIAVVKDDAAERRKARSDQLAADRKALYGQYCRDGDLYWASFNTVLDHHKTAVKRIAAQRASGKPATLRHHRFDGSGTIAVQLQRQAGAPPRTPMVLADEAGKYRNVLHIPGWTDPDVWEQMTRSQCRQSGRVTVRMRCGSTDGQPQWIDLPVQVHRWLPADADITGAELVVTRVAGIYRAKLCVTARIGDTEPVTSGPTVALHLGWRSTEEGTAVATWRSDAPLDIPFDLRTVMRVDAAGTSGTIVVPATIERRLTRTENIASSRSLALDALRDKVVGWLSDNDAPTYRDAPLEAATVKQWKSPQRFASLAHAWKDNGTEISDILWAWFSLDRKQWAQQENGRRKALGHRDDLYRQIAAVISDQAGHVLVDDTSVAELSARAMERTELPTEVQQKIDRRRDHAAPGGLRASVVAAMTRDGVPVTIVAAADFTRTHSRCGHVNPPDDRYLSNPVRCDGCGAMYDQDRSFVTLMLRAATAPSNP